ncbi:AAA family ATPase [Pseudomonas sp. zjy_15]|uniref:AAA family ATPase n=1 Tax=Pseudomonas sp. zjy_15 TaxID=3367265 RepID=UPI00370CB4F3
MSDFYIERVYAKNYRQFSTLDVSFNKGFNFITGPNGSGKTSILACIAHCLHHGTYSYSRFQENVEFWTDVTIPTDKFRIGMGSGSINPIGYRENALSRWNPPPQEDGRKAISTHQLDKMEEFCPLFIGSNRSIKYTKIAGMQREKPQKESSSQYTSKSLISLYGEMQTPIKQWFINRYFVIDKDWAAIERENWNHLITSLPYLGPLNSELKYIKTERDLEPVFSIYGEECYLEELSSGFQAVLYIVASIFEWIETTKPESNRLVAGATGTVLIDELDVHLHPEWQLTLRDGLRKIFPKLQFIVTTHSPHLLASAESGETLILPREHGQKDYIVKPTKQKFSGWNTDQILTDVMDVRSLASKDYEQAIHRAFTAIEEKSTANLKSEIQLLEQISHPNDSILTILNSRLAAMVAKQ